jgi:hypothetical protein
MKFDEKGLSPHEDVVTRELKAIVLMAAVVIGLALAVAALYW